MQSRFGRDTAPGVAGAINLVFAPINGESRWRASGLRTRILKVTVPLAIMFAAAISIASLWTWPFALAVALSALSILKHKVFPIKYELGWFVFVGMLGAFAESIIFQAGAWSYSNYQIINIPVWLPAIWGLTGTSLVVFYSGLSGDY